MDTRSAGDWWSRRGVLAATGTLTAGALAGCLGGGDGGSGGGGYGAGGGGGTVTDDIDTPAADPNSLQNHQAAGALADQPTLGPDPFDAESVIVAFEDPSCPRCRAFEQQTVPQIRSELVEPGRAAYVFRGYPVIYPWGEPATQALESTYARDVDAHWALADHYFAEQSAFTTENVLDRTHEFLAANTNLDADAVVADAEDEAHDDAVQTDLDAGMAAGAGRTTPHVFLFTDGQYVTKAAGSVSFSVVTNALGY